MIEAAHHCVCAASDEGGAGEQGGDHEAGGPGPGGALPQSVVLQRRSLLQQGEFTQRKRPVIKTATFARSAALRCAVVFQSSQNDNDGCSLTPVTL